MRRGDRVTFEGKPALVDEIRLDQVGDVDSAGRGILRPGMVADIAITDDAGHVLKRQRDVPLTDLQQPGA